MNKFLIFTDARTGSISLSKILGELYKNKLPYRVITEPFDKPSLSTYFPDISDKLKPELEYAGEDSYKITLKDIEKILDICFEHSSGIKHIWSHLDLESKLQNEFILNYAIRKKIKIILLTREDFVLRAVSLNLAKQSEVWSVEKEEWREQATKTTYGDIDIDELDKCIREYNRYLFRYRKLLAPFNYYDISYENFFKLEYREENRYCQQIKEVAKICKFLGLNKKYLTKEVLEFNLSKDRKQNTRVIYNKVPNMKKVVEYAEKEWDKDLLWTLESNDH